MLAHAAYHCVPAPAPFFVSLDQPAVNRRPGQGRRWPLWSASSLADQLRVRGGGGAVSRSASQQAHHQGRVAARSEPGAGDGLSALMLASVIEGICSVSAEGTCLFINAAGAAMLGYAPDELIGENLHDFSRQRRADGSVDLARGCPLLMTARNGVAIRLDSAVLWHKDGSAVYVSYCVSPLVREGQCVGAVMVFSQTDQCQRQMDELLEADRRRTEFLATLAHELRHPLAPLRNGLEFLRLKGDSPDTASVVAMMDRQVSHLARLVEDLLDAGRIASGKVELRRERVSLKSVIRSAIETSQPLIEARGHDLLVLDTLEDALAIDADAARIHQVLVNLLGNAARYTPGGGRIVISAHRDGMHAVVSVSDNGVGIAPEVLPGVFEMFSQAEPSSHAAQGGLGIGLALVRQFVELHGGKVSGASPGVGQGSTFTVRLPLGPGAGHRP